MKFFDYIKDKIALLSINLLIFVLLTLFIMVFIPSRPLLFIIILIWLLPVTSIIFIDYIKKVSFYNKVTSTLEGLDKKYLLSSLIDEPSFAEGEILYNVLKTTNKSMHEEINKYKYAQTEYREYIESWVHEVKTPISSSKLIIENNQTSVTLSLKEEVEKIEEFVDQALFYSRSNNVDRDYIVKSFSLKDAINPVIRKNSKYFIQNKIKLHFNETTSTVYSDIKWVHFILNQVTSNAIKYRSDNNPTITIYAEENENNINLYIVDNGIGIEERDIPKVFDKGFTGTIGRKYEKSTGMGLYLSKKLCIKLNLNIRINSNKGIGTSVCITFPKSKLTLLEG